jgi:molybdate transport repressor ModE-like protein
MCKIAQMLKWDDIRYFLAVARSGSIAGAARRLGVDHSTVHRRLQAIEETLAAQLFDKVGGGARKLTAAGDEILPAAERIEAEITAFQLNVVAREQRTAGIVRLSSPDGLAVSLIPPLVAAFRAGHPEIRVELITSNTPLNLTLREADVELRPIHHPNPALKGRKIARIAFAIYAAPAYLASRGGLGGRAVPDAAALAGLDWIFPDRDALALYSPADWLHATIPADRVVATASSAIVMMATAAAGLGLVALPCYLADRDPGLERVMVLDHTLWGDLWLLTRPELSRTPRVRAFLDHATLYFTSKRAILEGRSPRGRRAG